MDAKKFGSNIHKYRIAKGLTQDDAAEKCGLSTNYFRQIELGNKVPRLETFLRIAEVLEVSTDLLFAGNFTWIAEARSNELYKKIEQLPANQQDYVLSAVDSLVEGLKKIYPTPQTGMGYYYTLI